VDENLQAAPGTIEPICTSCGVSEPDALDDTRAGQASDRAAALLVRETIPGLDLIRPVALRDSKAKRPDQGVAHARERAQVAEGVERSRGSVAEPGPDCRLDCVRRRQPEDQFGQNSHWCEARAQRAEPDAIATSRMPRVPLVVKRGVTAAGVASLNLKDLC